MTLVRVPRVAVTVMPADGLTPAAPLPGVITTRGAGAVALAVGLAAAAGLAWVVPCPLPVQAAASKASAVMAAAWPSAGSRSSW